MFLVNSVRLPVKTETHVAGKHSKCVNEFPCMHKWPMSHAMLTTKTQRIFHKCSNLLLNEQQKKRAGHYTGSALYLYAGNML